MPVTTHTATTEPPTQLPMTTHTDTTSMTVMQTPELDDSTTPQDTGIATTGSTVATGSAGNDHSTATENVIRESAGGGNENSTGDFIAVAFGVLLLLIAVLVVAGITVYVLRQKKKKGELDLDVYV